MAASPDDQAGVRGTSPSPAITPTPALGASTELKRTLSNTSSLSHGSATTDATNLRDSLGSDTSAFSRQSSGSYAPSRRSDVSAKDMANRFSTMSVDRGASKRRGYMRPTGTDFAASARSRESVLNLGSIAHLQYYFARTGLLDGKGAQLARKRQQKGQTLDLSQLDPTTFLSPNVASGSDVDSSYASMGSSPELNAHSFGTGGAMLESPIQEEHPEQGDEWYMDQYDEEDPDMLPPTASTYIHREKPVPKPPTITELKADLRSSLDAAAKALQEARSDKEPADFTPAPTIETPDQAEQPVSPGWCEVQGMHILDVMTLAIRAAKVYYTSHEHPDRLDAIKSEKEVRAELLEVMDVLKRMATRSFAGGMRDDESAVMQRWVDGLYSMLRTEEEMEAAERAEREGWKWLREDGWARPVDREFAFLQSMLVAAPAPVEGMAELPAWEPVDRTRPLAEQTLPTPFLAHMQNGVRLVQLHNCAVRKSRRRFGTIPAFHADTQKPYRAADNLRYWIKAAELRWETLLKADALGIVYSSSPEVWVSFEDAILTWCRRVREEITGELSK
jgi:hypothetical protein